MSSRAMNLLLLLSALLSALTGVGGAVRAAEPAQAVAAVGVARPSAAVAAARAAIRPTNAVATLIEVAAAGVSPRRLSGARAPAWIDRRRE